jgi:hypothetical protein
MLPIFHRHRPRRRPHDSSWCQGLVETGGGANGGAGRAQLGVAVDLRRAEFTARDFELEAAMPARAVKREGLERPASGM